MENEIQIENCCYICTNRSFNSDGICCGLTQYMVDYVDCCDDFLMDEKAKDELAVNIKNKQAEDQVWENLSEFDKFLVKHTLFGKIKYMDSLNNSDEKKDDEK
jgi:hypothetical protein